MVAGNEDKGAAEVSVSIPQFNTEQLREITSFDQAMALATGSFGALVTASDLGDGFELVDQSVVVGQALVALAVIPRTGDLGNYVVVRAVTKGGSKVVFVDGGTGLNEQLRAYMDTHDGLWPQLWPHGLRVSEYTFETTDPKTGEVKTAPAKTYYLDTSA